MGADQTVEAAKAKIAAIQAPAVAAGTGELRVYLMVNDLRPQFAAFMGTPLRARGYPPLAGQHALIIEVAPGLMIERVLDLALKSNPDLEPGILFVERQFGILEIHGDDLAMLKRAGDAILQGIRLREGDQLRPKVLYTDIISNVSDQQAVIINRNRQGSMIMPGETLLVVELMPALYATIAANEAERAAPGVTLVDVQVIGAAGRLYMSGKCDVVAAAKARIEAVLQSIPGREVR